MHETVPLSQRRCGVEIIPKKANKNDANLP